MTVKPEHNTYKKSSSWISRLSICARDILSGTEQNNDQISICLAPEMPPSPESSGFTSIGPNDSVSHSTFITPSPSSSSSSSSSSTSFLSTENHRESPEQYQHEPEPQQEYSRPPLNSHNYFIHRPSPTQRRSPGRSRHSSTKDSSSNTAALDSLAQEILTYFVDPSSTSSKDLHSNGTPHTTELVEKLKSRLVSPTPVHPSLLKLTNDVLAFLNEAPALANELQQLKPKLEVCLLIHGKAVD